MNRFPNSFKTFFHKDFKKEKKAKYQKLKIFSKKSKKKSLMKQKKICSTKKKEKRIRFSPGFIVISSNVSTVL